MRICILSMQRVNNYGSLLQAYSLKKIIESLGHEVDFIDIERGKDDELNIQCENLAMNDENVHGNSIITQMLRVKNKVSDWKATRIFEDFRVNELEIKYNKEYFLYDVCVIGSDEVFNCLQKAKWGFSPQLFGNVKNANKIITYAASCGYTESEMLSEELKNAIRKALSRVYSISVRDENTLKFVQNLIKRECIYNLDPVAVGDFSKEIQNIDLRDKLPNRYCIVYSYKGRMEDDITQKAILDYCRKKDLTPIAPFGKQKWIKKQKILTPFELLKAFENAESIITDTFHGTLFGLKFGKRMAVIIRDSNRNKLGDLVKRCEIEEHVLVDLSKLEQVLEIEINKCKSKKLLDEERRRTLEYLTNNL